MEDGNFIQKFFRRISNLFKGKPKDQKIIGEDYSNFFFKSIRSLTWILFILGVVSAVIIFYSTGDIFKAIAVIFLLVWLVVFLRYFLWSVYHYNINFGLTDKDWARIASARKDKLEGKEVIDEELEEPKYNPFRSQTFGLPPGTVRGMIAFTLLFGAITILISSMGMDNVDIQNSLIRDQFEFFKTAFLMMIAFYFGDKSLKYLQKRWNTPGGTAAGTSNMENQVDVDDAELVNEDHEFRDLEKPSDLTSAGASSKGHMNAMHDNIAKDK